MNRAIIISLVLAMTLPAAVSAQAWRDCVLSSYGPGGCESYGPSGGKSYGPGGGKSYGPGGGLSPNRDRSRGLNTDTMRPFDQW